VSKLSEEQLRTLTFLLLRETMSSFEWTHFWRQSFPRTKRGEIDGNAECGRVRTLRALVRLGLADDQAWFTITDAGRARLREYVADERWKSGVKVRWARSPSNDGAWALLLLLPSGTITRAALVEALDTEVPA
jgi:hypothetical protein